MADRLLDTPASDILEMYAWGSNGTGFRSPHLMTPSERAAGFIKAPIMNRLYGKIRCHKCGEKFARREGDPSSCPYCGEVHET